MGIDMARAEPDRAALEVAHRMLGSKASLDDMLKNPTLQVVLKAVARRHMQRRARPDLKKLQSNDND
jgi:heme oxygenase